MCVCGKEKIDEELKKGRKSRAGAGLKESKDFVCVSQSVTQSVHDYDNDGDGERVRCLLPCLIEPSVWICATHVEPRCGCKQTLFGTDRTPNS